MRLWRRRASVCRYYSPSSTSMARLSILCCLQLLLNTRCFYVCLVLYCTQGVSFLCIPHKCARVHAPMHTHTYICTHTHTHTHLLPSTHKHSVSHTPSVTHTHIHTHTHTHTRTQTHSHSQSRTHIHSFTEHTNTNMDVFVCLCVCVCACGCFIKYVIFLPNDPLLPCRPKCREDTVFNTSACGRFWQGHLRESSR